MSVIFIILENNMISINILISTKMNLKIMNSVKSVLLVYSVPGRKLSLSLLYPEIIFIISVTSTYITNILNIIAKMPLLLPPVEGWGMLKAKLDP